VNVQAGRSGERSDSHRGTSGAGGRDGGALGRPDLARRKGGTRGGGQLTAEQAEIAALREQVRTLGAVPVSGAEVVAVGSSEVEEDQGEGASLMTKDASIPKLETAAVPTRELGTLADGTKIRHRLVLFTISMNAILVMACNTMFMPAIVTVQDELNTTPTLVAMCLTVYTLGSGLTPLVMGPVADIVGRRTPMLISHVIFIVATICAALAPNIESLLLARTLEALGGCPFLVLGQAQVGDIYPREQLGQALAVTDRPAQLTKTPRAQLTKMPRFGQVFSLSRMSAALFGPVVGGVICQFFGWRSTFWACAGLDIILATICFFYVPETLLTPESERPSISWTIPFRPLGEIVRDRSVGA
jgi:Na+/melibiose symporter-like transporter